MKKILVITTGGTIDAKPYENTPEFTTPADKSTISEVIHDIGANHCEVVEFGNKDSKLYTEDEIKLLIEFIRSSDYSRIIITHGTDATIKNAKLLQNLLADSGKTIIFTGAMTPLSHGKESDGKPNLAYAVEQVADLEAGVYIVGREEIANGRFGPGLFEPNQVAKDHGRKTFVRQGTEVSR